MGETRRITTWAEGAGDKQLQHLQVINSNLQAADRCFSLLGVRCDGVVVGCGVCGEHLETPVVVSDDGVAEIRSGGRLEEKEWKTLNRPGTRWPVLGALPQPHLRAADWPQQPVR